MGQSESKKKIEEQFQIFKVEKDGNAFLKSKKDGKQYLMRVITCTSQADIDRLKALLECRAKLKNHHILSLVEIKEKQQDFVCSIHYKMYLVLEYSFKNLAQEIKERANYPQKNYFQESDIWSILYSCCTALNILYSSGATHQSLTAEQIFINKDGFVKITEPLLFGLEKNHLQAMRTKQQNNVNIHLSPQIISCLDDQNFFFYDKEKSDIFVVAMIIIDIALLSNNYLYHVVKKRPIHEEINSLIGQVAQKYSHNLVSVLVDMLQIQCRLRPSLVQIIEKVQKYNNISQDFTVESQSNIRSNELYESKQQKVVFEKPIKYQQLTIQQHLSLVESKKKTQPIVPHGYSAVTIQQQSLSIKEPSIAFNQQNFDGRIFATTPHQSNFHNIQGVFSTYQQDTNIQNPVLNGLRYSLQVEEKPRNIQSIKVTSRQFTHNDQAQAFSQSNIAKPTNYFYVTQKKPQVQLSKPKHQPIFTHQIPQVYNILIKTAKSSKLQMANKLQNTKIPYNQHVATPHADLSKQNKFSNFINYPHETSGRFGYFSSSPLQTGVNTNFKQIEKKYNPYQKVGFNQTPPDPFTDNTKNTMAGSSSPFKFNQNPFASSNPSPGHTSISVDNAFANSSSSGIVSSSFIPNIPARRVESFTSQSQISHLNLFNRQERVKLEFVKEQIPQKGRYQGYKYNDLRNGHGILYFKDGGHYEGQWKNDKMQGFGKLYYQSGKIAYQGNWDNDQFNGQGRVYNSQPVGFDEQFNYKDFSELGNRWVYYQGQFKNDSKHGKGYIKLTNGQMFEGIFDHDMIQGNGIFYKRSGQIRIGFWIDNKLFLNQSFQHEKK